MRSLYMHCLNLKLSVASLEPQPLHHQPKENNQDDAAVYQEAFSHGEETINIKSHTSVKMINRGI